MYGLSVWHIVAMRREVHSRMQGRSGLEASGCQKDDEVITATVYSKCSDGSKHPTNMLKAWNTKSSKDSG